jgi:purine-cytosine permease-like protein
MMENIFNLRDKKSWKGAIVFYFAFFLIAIAFSFIVGAAVGIGAGVEDAEEGFALGMKIGQVAAIIIVFLLGIFILKKKDETTHFGLISIVLFATILSIFGGLLFGLIPLAYLTTRAPKIVAPQMEVVQPDLTTSTVEETNQNL